jgi:hypothetical protein
MCPLDAALRYAGQGWPVFPCRPIEPGRKRPMTRSGFHDASTEAATIRAWWRRLPDALIGVPTGRATGLVILDIDVKNDRANGYDTLDDLGHSILPDTWLVHTASGGLHLYFDPGDREIRNSAGKLGPGLDIRGDGGYVIAPSPNSGYEWDLYWNPDTSALLTVPDWLIGDLEPLQIDYSPHPVVRQPVPRYGEVSLDNAVVRIISAPSGMQRDTLNEEVFAIAGLVAGGLIPSTLALEALNWAACRMVSHDPRRPWSNQDLVKAVNAAFIDGLRHPRQPGRGR